MMTENTEKCPAVKCLICGYEGNSHEVYSRGCFDRIHEQLEAERKLREQAESEAAALRSVIGTMAELAMQVREYSRDSFAVAIHGDPDGTFQDLLHKEQNAAEHIGTLADAILGNEVHPARRNDTEVLRIQALLAQPAPAADHQPGVAEAAALREAVEAARSLLAGEKESEQDLTIWGPGGKNLNRIRRVKLQCEKALLAHPAPADNKLEQLESEAAALRGSASRYIFLETTLQRWEDGEYVICVGGMPLGYTLSKRDGEIIEKWLHSAERELETKGAIFTVAKALLAQPAPASGEGGGSDE